ncbi:Uma2 family endonuclease [Rubrivirga sp.]|uniref:Uma2 family endonuclease n=1 Tax=Rubrivirga sp. TaxID=1885344 RepID=UPI003B527011
MPATAARTLTFTPEEYFEWETTQEVRHEYHFGEVFPTPGGTFAHATVSLNLGSALLVALRGSNCRPVSNDMRVEVLAGGQYVYPDVTVYCGEPAFVNDRKMTLVNPAVVCEVLSPDTRAYDLGEKLALYRGVPSIQTVLYADPDRRWAQLARRTETTWVRDEPVTEGPVEIGALGVALDLADLYAGLG